MKLREIKFSIFYLLILIPLFPIVYGCGDLPTSSTTSTSSLEAVTVSPSSISLSLGSTESFTSFASYADGTSAEVSATWSISPSSFGSITASGHHGLLVVTSEGSGGSGFVLASYNGKSGSSTITVSAPAKTLASIGVTSTSNVPLWVGSTETLTATGNYSDGSTSVVNATWRVTPEALGSIIVSGSNGLFTAVATGSGWAIASFEGKTGNIAVDVIVKPKSITSIAVSPSSKTLAISATQVFTSIATYDDATTGEVEAVWTVSNAYGTIISSGYNGLFTAGGSAGTGFVIATVTGVAPGNASFIIQ